MSQLEPDIYGVSPDSFAATLDIAAFAKQKEAALRAHRSQTGPRSSFAGASEDAWRNFLVTETFILGGLRGSFPEMPVSDLFAGL
jgi:N-acetyl-1-D-myo-inositol-2-amino-2-deoxy-alpha-D-glucopyranoside deacetylase